MKDTENTKKRKPRENDDTVVENRGPAPGVSSIPISSTEQARTATAHARINIPITLSNWADRPQKQQELLTWFHQHILNEGVNWDKAKKLLPKAGAKGGFYDHTVIYRILHGTYEGSWDNICNSIIAYRNLWEERRKLKRSTFAENSVSRLIWGALNYALTVEGITKIVGESGQGKTFCTREWQERNNHGKTVMVEAPTMGGPKAFLRSICKVIGGNRNMAVPKMVDKIMGAFNPHRMLIIDEAHRLLPSSASVFPRSIDFIREIHDTTGCAIAFIVTDRFDETLHSNAYMFEQILGRIDMPIRLMKDMSESAWLPLLIQYIPNPTTQLKEVCSTIVNTPLTGRMRHLDKLLKFASHIASTDNQPMTETHVLKAIKLRKQMMGETNYAKKQNNRQD